MITLQFMVRVSADEYGRPLAAKDWEPIARRLARVAKGRSKRRSATVWVDQPYHHVAIDEAGKVSVRKDGHDLAFRP